MLNIYILLFIVAKNCMIQKFNYNVQKLYRTLIFKVLYPHLISVNDYLRFHWYFSLTLIKKYTYIVKNKML